MDDLKRAARKRAEADRALRPTKRSTGVVTSIVDATHVWVNVGTRSVKATVPSSVSALAIGARVLLREDNESVIEAALGSYATGALWAGNLAASVGTLTASNYTSLDMSAQTRSGGGLVPVWTGHCLTIPESRSWQLHLQATFTTTSTTGNRLASLWLNPNATTWDSASTPAAGSWLRVRQGSAGTASTGIDVLWSGWLDAGSLVMPLARTTSATGISTSQWDTELTIEAR